MNISRTKAEAVAKKLTAHIVAEADKERENARAAVIAFVDNATPSEVKEFRKNFPKWIDESQHHKIHGLPIYFSMIIQWRKGELRLDGVTADKVTKIMYKEKDIRDKAEKIYHDIVNTLLSLKTYNRCKEAFPEAYALLPDSVSSSNLPVARIDAIRERLGLPTPNEN